MEVRNTKNQLFRYRKANEFSLDELQNSYIYFPSSLELNDPFDASHTMLKMTRDDSEIEKLYNELIELSPNGLVTAYIEKKFKNKPEELRELVVNSTASFISTYGIACFTVTPIHIVLWANYAENHEGICIQYDITRDKEFFKGAKKIEYVEKLDVIDYQPITNPKASNDIFYRKLNLWEKEFEVRLVKPRTEKHYMNPECVRSIILGLRAKDEYIEKVIDIVRRKYKHATLYQAELMTKTVGLSFIPFDL